MKQDVHTEKMRDRLRELSAADDEAHITKALRRLIEDPLKMATKSGRIRVNPILVLLGLLAAVAAGAFAYSSFGSL